jgi:hypothetical protein
MQGGIERIESTGSKRVVMEKDTKVRRLKNSKIIWYGDSATTSTDPFTEEYIRHSEMGLKLIAKR